MAQQPSKLGVEAPFGSPKWLREANKNKIENLFYKSK